MTVLAVGRFFVRVVVDFVLVAELPNIMLLQCSLVDGRRRVLHV